MEADAQHMDRGRQTGRESHDRRSNLNLQHENTKSASAQKKMFHSKAQTKVFENHSRQNSQLLEPKNMVSSTPLHVQYMQNSRIIETLKLIFVEVEEITEKKTCRVQLNDRFNHRHQRKRKGKRYDSNADGLGTKNTELLPNGYFQFQNRVRTMLGITFFHDNVVLPAGLREGALNSLHFGPLGETKMIDNANISWWPRTQDNVKMGAKCVPFV